MVVLGLMFRRMPESGARIGGMIRTDTVITREWYNNFVDDANEEVRRLKREGERERWAARVWKRTAAVGWLVVGIALVVLLAVQV